MTPTCGPWKKPNHSGSRVPVPESLDPDPPGMLGAYPIPQTVHPQPFREGSQGAPSLRATSLVSLLPEPSALGSIWTANTPTLELQLQEGFPIPPKCLLVTPHSEGGLLSQEWSPLSCPPTLCRERVRPRLWEETKRKREGGRGSAC